MRQTSLNLPRVAHAAPSPLTSLLSQYELLTMLCENLSSADIVHLGATFREHWQYVGHNSIIFKGLIAGSTCDGKGIIAQARVFGYWQADPEKATRQCRGKDAKPCSDCGAMVCNMCRYHISYRPSGNPPEPESWDPELWDEVEEDLACDVHDYYFSEENCSHVVELLKAIKMYRIRNESYCEDYEPVFVEDQRLRGWCHCTLYSHFVATWRCIPCVLAEEAKLTASQQKFKVVLRPDFPRNMMYWRTKICGCGKEEADRSTETCRWCGMIASYYYGREPHHLRRVREQLGSLTDLERRDDPVLSQLG